MIRIEITYKPKSTREFDIWTQVALQISIVPS
jgi:hypothetical protein